MSFILTLRSLMQILQQSEVLSSSTLYNLTLQNLRLGSQGFLVTLNGSPLSTIHGSFSPINFDVLNGPLFVGGHPFLNTLQVMTNAVSCVHPGSNCM